MGHSKLTGATAVSSDITVRLVTFYGGRINLRNRSPENFHTVSTTEAPKFLKAVAAVPNSNSGASRSQSKATRKRRSTTSRKS